MLRRAICHHRPNFLLMSILAQRPAALWVWAWIKLLTLPASFYE
jgi:hypothetical protein